MEGKLKQELSQFFEAPAPKQKKKFIRQIGMQRVSIFSMMKVQFHYISKFVWIFSIIFFMLALLASRQTDAKNIGIILAIIPFWCTLSIVESMRSYSSGMEELEMTTRFSLKSILLTRMIVLGIGNILLLLMLALFIGNSMWANVIFMLVPYLCTSSGGLMIVRKFPNKDGNYICFAFAALVAAIELIISFEYSFIYELQNINVWILVCILLILTAIRESYRTIRMTEDFIWN